MVVLSKGEKWYKEQSTVITPMDLETFEKYHDNGSSYDFEKMAQVMDITLSVCYSYEPELFSNVIVDTTQSHRFLIVRKVPLNNMMMGWKSSEEKHVYLTIEEIHELYKDPKSIWNKAIEWERR